MLTTAQGQFVIVGLESGAAYFWRGQPLAEVRGLVAHVDEDTQHIKLRVLNTANYDSQYAQMAAAGISVKKVSA
jgi:hypothetical protein